MNRYYQKRRFWAMPLFIILGLVGWSCTEEENDFAPLDEQIENTVDRNSSARVTIPLTNPSFESDWDGWNDNDPSAISGEANSGSKSAKITGSSGRVEQSVSVTPNTNYTLTAYVLDEGRVGAVIAGSDVGTTVDNSDWGQVTVSFSSGSASSITIYGAYGGGEGRFDDFALESTDIQPPVYTPERHSEMVGKTVRLKSNASGLWSRISTTGDYANVEMISQQASGNWTRWVVEEVNEGGQYYYRFKNVGTNRRFRPASAMNSNVNVGRTSWTGSWTHWMVIAVGNEEYILVNRNQGTLLSAGNNTANAVVQHVSAEDGDKTKWRIEDLDGNDAGENYEPPTPGGDYPYDVLGLTNWKITLPRDLDNDDDADEIYVDEDDNDISSDPSFAQFEDDDYFWTDGTWVYFKCQAGGTTTGNSDNPRTELREMVSNGSDEIYWDLRSSTLRKMEFITRITQTPSSGKVCFAQIHGEESLGWDDIIRLQIRTSGGAGSTGDTGTLYVIGDATGDSADDIGSYTLGDELNMRIEAQNSTVRIYLNNVEVKTYYDISSPENYFKAGNYLQSKPSSGFGQTEFRLIKTTPN